MSNIRWTKKAPKTPGWYWWRPIHGETVFPSCACIYGEDCKPRGIHCVGEWWPKRILEPSEEEPPRE